MNFVAALGDVQVDGRGLGRRDADRDLLGGRGRDARGARGAGGAGLGGRARPARTAGAGLAHLPEVVLLVEPEDRDALVVAHLRLRLGEGGVFRLVEIAAVNSFLGLRHLLTHFLHRLLLRGFVCCLLRRHRRKRLLVRRQRRRRRRRVEIAAEEGRHPEPGPVRDRLASRNLGRDLLHELRPHLGPERRVDGGERLEVPYADVKKSTLMWKLVKSR